MVVLQQTWFQYQQIGAGVMLGLTLLGFLMHMYYSAYRKL